MTTHKPVTEADIAAALRFVLEYVDWDGGDMADAAPHRVALEAALAGAALPEPEPTAREDDPTPERLADMAVTSLGEFTTLPEYERIHQKFRASSAALPSTGPASRDD